jgi:CBS domain-containing protein
VGLLAPLLATTLAIAAPGAPTREHAFALLADNRIVAVAVPSGRVTARLRLAPRPQGPISEGRFLALDARDRRLFILVQTGTGADWIAVVDSRTLKVRARFSLEPDISYRGIVLAGDLLYAYGGRFGREVDTTNHVREESAVLTQLDAANGVIRTSTTIRPANGHSWWIFWAAARADASGIALSYHGGCFGESIELCTTGADWIDVHGTSFTTCQRAATPYGCLADAHGMIEPYGVGWIAATGGETLVQYGRSGNVLRRLRTGIDNDHLMEFAFNPTRSRLYVLGSCGTRGWLRRVSLGGSAPALIGRGVCGDGLIVGRTSFVIRRGRTLDLRSLRTARLLHQRPLATDILDVIAGR